MKYLGLDKIVEDMKEEVIKAFMQGYAALAAAKVGVDSGTAKTPIISGTVVESDEK